MIFILIFFSEYNREMKTLKKKVLIIENEDNNGKDEDARAVANINELNNKYKLLEIKVSEMAKLIDTLLLEKKGEENKVKNYKKKFSVLDLLNSSSSLKKMNQHLNQQEQQHQQQQQSFNAFVSADFNQKHLNILFDHKYEESYVFILLDLLALYEKKYNFNIVHAFNQQTNTLFIYSVEEAQWTIWSLKSIYDILYQKIHTEFIIWQNENRKRFEDDDDLAIKYSMQLIKIMGNTSSYEKISSLITNKLYKSLKMDLREFI